MASELFEPSPLAQRVSREQQDVRERDLGFGTVVGRDSRLRLLNRDGSFNVVRRGLGVFAAWAPYHVLLTITWARFFALVALVYVAVNLAFAAMFTAFGADALTGALEHGHGGTFARAFFFSVQTFATIGYGQVAPQGLGPNLIVTFEALVGLMFQALATGLLFARFARPTASIAFSRNAVIAPYAEGRSLQFRIANRRRGEIIQLEAQVLFSYLENDGRGRRVRRYQVLPLERNKVAFFPLSWTIVHPIDTQSPLMSRDRDDLIADEAEILVLLSGVDEAFAQTVHTRSSYRPEEIIWNARFASMFVAPQDGVVGIDLTRLDEVDEIHESAAIGPAGTPTAAGRQ
jgi:inward rectifier potassium channel